MRAYLAVIKDSFREAFASRVLWILLLFITLFLVALSPLATKVQLASTLRPSDIHSGTEFPQTLQRQSQSTPAAPGKHLWPLLSESLREQISQLENDDIQENSDLVLFELVRELNTLLERPDFYNEEDWKRYPLSDEAKKLQQSERSELSPAQLRRLNRLALDAAFAEHIERVPKQAVQVVYFGYEIGDSFPATYEQTQQFIKTLLVQVMNFLVGTLGIFVAILVTAPIIPHMFEPGAIDLLLSRPVSRSFLFLAKFLGGCAFIVLNSVYLIAGLWIYVGLRFDIWSNKLLLCVPVFLFLFAIYYSVSALAGVVWRNAVVSIVVAILFWVACFTVGTSKGVVETMFLNPRRMAVVVPAGETLIAANKSGETFQWLPDEREWMPVFQAQISNPVPFGMFYPMVGPVYDSQADRLVAIQSAVPGAPGFAGTGKLAVAKREENWRRISGVNSPSGTQSLFIDREGKILVAGTGGVFRFEGDPTVEHVPFKILGKDIAPRGKAGRFVAVGPKEIKAWPPPLTAGRNAADDSLAIYSRGELRILALTPEDRYEIKRETDLETNRPALVAFAGRKVMVALESGEIRQFDVQTLKELDRFQPFKGEKPRQIVATKDGRWFAVLFHNQELWLYDAEQNQPADIDIAGQGNISAIAFSTNNELLVADRYPRVLGYSLKTGTVAHRYESETELLEKAYRFIIKPIYTVFPKPGELDNLVTYLLTDQEEATIGREKVQENLQSERITLNIWQPVWSNLAFLTVILLLTCIYIERKDF